MTTKHTPGPWTKRDVTRQRDDGSTELVANEVMAGTVRIASVDDPKDQALIAAAPDMLAALREIAAWAEQANPAGYGGLREHLFHKVQSAISKATENPDQ